MCEIVRALIYAHNLFILSWLLQHRLTRKGEKIMNKKIFWPFVVAAFVQAILSFGKTGVVGAVLSALVILAVVVILFDGIQDKLKAKEKKDAEIAEAEILLSEAEENFEDAKEAFLMESSDENKANYKTAKAEYISAKKNLAEIKKK